jgi:hypothetical protein
MFLIMDYALTIGENSTIASSLNNNVNFLMEDKCDFSVSSSLDPTELSIYQIAGQSTSILSFKKTRKAISATINTQTFYIWFPRTISNN